MGYCRGWTRCPRREIEDALKRETFEELGITKFKARFLGSYVWESSRERELVFPFLCTSHDAIHINNDEVDEGRFWSRKEIEQNADTNICLLYTSRCV